jgi:glycosyltransferase involved in cell wall biosynthesis
VRILIATAHRRLVGGVEKYLQAVIPALQRRGHFVALVYDYPCDAGEAGIDSHATGVPAWCSMDLGVSSVLSSIKAWAPDVVYCQGLDNSPLERSLLDSYPTTLFAHTYHGTCISGRKCQTRPRLQPCSRRFGRACLVLYHPLGCGGNHPLTAWRMFQAQSLRKRNLPDYRAVLVASRHMYREFERNGVAESHLHLVPLFATERMPQAVAPSPRDPGGRILFVGRLVDVKGVNYLLQAIPLAAAALSRPLTLTIAGDGEERKNIEESAARLGVTVEFSGWVDAERISDLMRQAHLLAVPSLWPEPFGLTGIEAGCFGLPAVGFAVGGIPDWLIPGQSGELASGDPPTVQGLADAMVRALADATHYRRLCVGAWEVAQQFSIERHMVELERILAVKPGIEPSVAAGPAEQVVPTIV